MMAGIASYIATAMAAAPIRKGKRHNRPDKYSNGYNKAKECSRRLKRK